MDRIEFSMHTKSRGSGFCQKLSELCLNSIGSYTRDKFNAINIIK